MCSKCNQTPCSSGCSGSTTTTTTIVKIPCHTCGETSSSNSPCTSCSEEGCEDYTGTNCVLSDINDVTIGKITLEKNEKLTSVILKLLYRIEQIEKVLSDNSIVIP